MSTPSKPHASSSDPRVRPFADAEALSQAAASLIAERAEEAVQARGRFSLALAGGSTPQRTYELLGTDFRAQMPWKKTHLFWGDERFVPPEDEDSNFKMAYEAFVRDVPVPPENIHRVLTELDTVEAAAEAYDDALRQFFGADDPQFDVVLLGLGEDGHTASVFPGLLDAPNVRAREAWAGRQAVAVEGPESRPPRERVTLTMPALNHARCALFLVSGQAKRSPMHTVLWGEEEARQALPAAHVRPRGDLVWFADEAAYGDGPPQ